VRRRDILKLGGGAFVPWPFAANAQQTQHPVIGLLSSRSADVDASLVTALHEGLAESGFAEGRNVKIEYRWAQGQYERLPSLAAELVKLPVTVLVSTGGTISARAAKAATQTIPVVFTTADDPVKVGLVASLNKPGGNLTGISAAFVESASKRLGLLRELMPKASAVGFLVNPANPAAAPESREVETAARAFGQRVAMLHASSERDIDAVFESVKQKPVDAIVVASDPFLFASADKIVAAAARQAIPTLYFRREFVTRGGLVAYGSDFAKFFRVVGLYAGRILKGAKPSELPVQRPDQFHLVINLQTARSLGLDIPAMFLARADEVIE
jgi:putative ABC transport system substrate-binding protein